MRNEGATNAVPDQRCSTDAVVHVAEIHGELGGERARGELGQRQPLGIVGFSDPPAALDEVAAHVADKRDGTPEAQRAQAQGIEH
jgi:hypothetical protein